MIYYVPFTSHSNFPFLTEMLYTVGLSIGSIGAAKLFHFSMYLCTAVAVYSMGKRHLNATVGKFAALIYMSAPVVLYEAGIAYADITMGFYILLAVYAMLNWQETKNTRWLVACSVMCGFALGTKVLTAIPIFAICLLILMSSGREGRWGRGFKLGLLVGLGGILVGSVWYIKAYVYTGNPFYPFLYGIFGGKNWSLEAARTYQAEQNSFGMGKGIAQLFLLPWNLLSDGTKFTNKASANVFAVIGPAFVGLIPVYVLRGKINRALLQISAVAVIFLVAWFGLMQHSRYLIAGLPLLSIIAAAGADAGLKDSKIGKTAVVVFLTLTVGLSVYAGSLLAMLSFQPAFGLQSQEEYLTNSLDVYDAESYMNKNLPADAKIVLFDEVRGFYLDREYIWGNPGHHEMIPWKSFKTGNDMVRWFRAHGYTHMLVNRMFGAGAQDDIHGKLFPDAIGSGIMKEVYGTKTCTVYEFGG